MKKFLSLRACKLLLRMSGKGSGGKGQVWQSRDEKRKRLCVLHRQRWKQNNQKNLLAKEITAGGSLGLA